MILLAACTIKSFELQYILYMVAIVQSPQCTPIFGTSLTLTIWYTEMLPKIHVHSVRSLHHKSVAIGILCWSSSVLTQIHLWCEHHVNIQIYSLNPLYIIGTTGGSYSYQFLCTNILAKVITYTFKLNQSMLISITKITLKWMVV